MSEKIKITIVSENEKLNNGLDDLNGQSVILTHDTSMTLMSTLLANNVISGSFCGGRGDCGRCRIQFLQGVTLPAGLERSVLESEELRRGYRLACLAKPKSDCVIKLCPLDAPEIAIISDMIGMTENIDYISQNQTHTQKQKTNVTESILDTVQHIDVSECSVNSVTDVTDNNETDVIIAVDLGTTTIAMQLMEMDTGRVIDTYCKMNPQRSYGADVLSRIQASCDGNRDKLQAMVIEVLERGVERFIRHDLPIRCMCIAGNTTMGHLLMGYDVSSLGHSPFTPVECGLQEFVHPVWDFKVWIVPCISAFVGGDIVAGLYACGLLTCDSENESARHTAKKQNSDEHETTVLLIDLGTNGEMAITDGKRMIVAATAAGPAFEGGAGAGIVGSDMVACTAELLRQGIMDETGLLAEPYFTEGLSVQIADKGQYLFTAGRSRQKLHLTQTDIRSLQMAKSAVRAGVEILLEQIDKLRQGKLKSNEQQQNNSKLPEHRVERVCLAGGFGYYLDVEAAFAIGLLPEHMRGRVQAVGNTSLEGAYRIGRDLWHGKTDGRSLERSISSIDSINLAKQPDFEKLYIQYMNFSSDM